MREQRPCSCGGSNENCTHCYGRGFIEGGRAFLASRGKRRKRGASQSTSQAFVPLTRAQDVVTRAQDVVKCPACEFKGSADDFTMHFALQHGSKGRRRRRTQLPTGCVAAKNKRKTTAANPRLDSSSPRLPKSVGPMRSRAATVHPMKSCPLCSSKVREDRLQKHMSRRCPLRKQRVKMSQGNDSSESLRYKGQLEVERPSWWNNLDATKNYGYPAREAGRYGSHPAHDPFDDESKP